MAFILKSYIGCTAQAQNLNSPEPVNSECLTLDMS